MTFEPDLKNMKRTIEEVAQLGSLYNQGSNELSEDLVQAILEEAGKLSREIFRPLAEGGDQFGAEFKDHEVTTAPGYKDAMNKLKQGGWLGLSSPEQFGGQGLPHTLSLALFELLHAGDPSLSMGPLLSTSAIEALVAHASPKLQKCYIEKLVSGEWFGTMNLTESNAGSDLGLLATKAEPQADGSYALSGQKIYITCGEHDLCENIIHLVLARTTEAPAGSKGISLFLVPKFLLDEKGAPAERNNVLAVGMEEKMGLHSSPTMVMQYDGAKGWLVGEENKGLACMFTMMNTARVHVGIQAVGIAQSAYQHALAYSKERKQGKTPGVEGPSPIVHHGDVQHMLINIQSHIRAARAICYATMGAKDLSTAFTSTDPELAKRYKRREELLTPIAKAWSSDMAVEMTAKTCQIWGGMGFVEESGAPRYYRDAKITTIYEGTNGIQAIDLVGRKLSMENGLAMQELIDDLREIVGEFDLPHDHYEELLVALENATDAISNIKSNHLGRLQYAATTYLKLVGNVVGAIYLQKLHEATPTDDPDHTFSRSLSRYFLHFIAKSNLHLAPSLEKIDLFEDANNYFEMTS